MSETRCETSCYLYGACERGEMDLINLENESADIRRHEKADIPDITKEARIIVSRTDKASIEHAIGRVIQTARNGECKEPGRITKTCRNPYAKTLPKRTSPNF